MSITAAQIVALLRSKHSKDVFVPECKDGPTQFGTHFRMDAWVMSRSWAHPCVRAYEVKVSRGDFLKDDKWRAYLACCNQFAFVCPRGLIDPAELPADVGLYYVSTNARMLTTKRKPVFRDVTVPESVWRYILMCRTRIVGEAAENTGSAEYWREWLATKAENRVLGHLVACETRMIVERTNKENARLIEDMKAYDGVRGALAELGLLSNARWLSPEAVRRQAQRVIAAVPENLIRELDSTIVRMRGLSEALAGVRVEAAKKVEVPA